MKKVLLYLFIAFVLMHWMSSGQDDVIEGPPEVLFEQSK